MPSSHELTIMHSKMPNSLHFRAIANSTFFRFGTVPEVYLDTLGIVLLFVWLACFLCLVEGSTLIETTEGLPGQEIFQPCYRLTLCASSTYPILCTPEQVIVTSIVPSDFPAAISCHIIMGVLSSRILLRLASAEPPNLPPLSMRG